MSKCNSGNNIDFDAFDKFDDALTKTRQIVDEITYNSYFHNRRLSPDVPLSEWSKIFENVDQLEERYQEELYFNKKEFNIT